jgi:hypothetical protein
MSEPQHTYPPIYTPGESWAADEAWAILDTLRPGVLTEVTRLFLAGMVTGALLRLSRDGRLQPPATPQEDTS